MEARPGIEPGCKDLQSSASPLRHRAARSPAKRRFAWNAVRPVRGPGSSVNRATACPGADAAVRKRTAADPAVDPLKGAALACLLLLCPVNHTGTLCLACQNVLARSYWASTVLHR